MPSRGRAKPGRGISVSSRRGWGPGASENVAVLRRSTMVFRFIRHRIVSNVIYELPYGIQLGGIMTANAAPPYNITTGTDANRDGDNNDRPAGVGFNTGRGDKF